MQLTQCEKIINEKKFLETHEIRSKIGGEVNKAFIERLELYYKIKKGNDGNN